MNKDVLINCKVEDVIEFGSLPRNLIRDKELIKKLEGLNPQTSVFNYEGKKYYQDKEIKHATGDVKFFDIAPAKWLVLEKTKNLLTITAAEISVCHHPQYLFEFINSTMMNLAFDKGEKKLFKVDYDPERGVYYGDIPTVKEIQRYNLDKQIPNVTDFGKKMQFVDYKWNAADTEHNFWCHSNTIAAMWLEDGIYKPGTCPGLPFFGARPILKIDLRKVK